MSEQGPTARIERAMSGEGLSIRVTSTGVKVIEGDCPHCGHRAMDHWSDGCKGGRGGADHCRMDPWKLERLARIQAFHFGFVTDRFKRACGATEGHTTNVARQVTCPDCLASPLMPKEPDDAH